MYYKHKHIVRITPTLFIQYIDSDNSSYRDETNMNPIVFLSAR